jgi:hypothetical protein
MFTYSKLTMTPISPWKQLSAYVALVAVAFGLPLCCMPIISLFGLPLGLIGLAMALQLSLSMVGEEKRPRRFLGYLLGVVGVILLLVGAGACADAAAAHFRAVSGSHPDPFPRNVPVPLLFSLGGALVLAYVPLAMCQGRARELWPHGIYWFLYGPSTLGLTYYLGQHGAVFGT